MISPAQANALPGWDHLKLGRTYMAVSISGQRWTGTLVDARVITTGGGQAAGMVLALATQDDAAPVTLFTTGLSAVEPG